jgi:hypothetical protein
MSLERFIALWMTPDYPPRPVSEEGLRSVEARFGFACPADYREAVLRFGLVSPTLALLDTIVDRELDVADLSQLLDPKEMIESTDGWRGMGLPLDMIAFATDCCGNLFCFDEQANGAPVFLFDHDFGTTKPIAPSFTRWIEAYCALAPH